MNSFRTFAAFILGLGILALSFASQNVIANSKKVEKIIKEDFWGKLYANGGKTFYCQKEFTKQNPLLAESYVYSTSWMKDHLQCGTSRQCKRESEDYVAMISDLHNIVPADSYFDFKRKSSVFGTTNNSVKPNKCGIRKAFQVIEPRNDTKGDIARIILYMHTRYDLPMKLLPNELKQWSNEDPPSEDEIKRNKMVEEIQGNSNPYIDDPNLANNIEN